NETLHPRSTLLPYTTLFRSRRPTQAIVALRTQAQTEEHNMLARDIMTSPVVTAAPDMPVNEAIRLLDKHDITALPVVDQRDRLVDRKSTRLNSSHVKNSYAV